MRDISTNITPQKKNLNIRNHENSKIAILFEHTFVSMNPEKLRYKNNNNIINVELSSAFATCVLAFIRLSQKKSKGFDNQSMFVCVALNEV